MRFINEDNATYCSTLYISWTLIGVNIKVKLKCTYFPPLYADMLKNTVTVSNTASHVTIRLNKDTANFIKPPNFHKSIASGHVN